MSTAGSEAAGKNNDAKDDEATAKLAHGCMEQHNEAQGRTTSSNGGDSLVPMATEGSPDRTTRKDDGVRLGESRCAPHGMSSTYEAQYVQTPTGTSREYGTNVRTVLNRGTHEGSHGTYCRPLDPMATECSPDRSNGMGDCIRPGGVGTEDDQEAQATEHDTQHEKRHTEGNKVGSRRSSSRRIEKYAKAIRQQLVEAVKERREKKQARQAGVTDPVTAPRTPRTQVTLEDVPRIDDLNKDNATREERMNAVYEYIDHYQKWIDGMRGDGGKLSREIIGNAKALYGQWYRDDDKSINETMKGIIGSAEENVFLERVSEKVRGTLPARVLELVPGAEN